MRKQIRNNEEQEKELELFMAKTGIQNHSEGYHLAIQYALKYFDNVTDALNSAEFEVKILRKTKSYVKKQNRNKLLFG